MKRLIVAVLVLAGVLVAADYAAAAAAESVVSRELRDRLDELIGLAGQYTESSTAECRPPRERASA